MFTKIANLAPSKLNFIFASIALMLNTVLFSCAQQELTCVDLIKEFSNLPPELKFQGCELSNESQLSVLRATYQVSGRQATKVENFLVENYQMSPLKFVCCGWESATNAEGRRYGTYSDLRGYYYEIRMYSGEVLIPEQLKRENVPNFYVEVVGYLEEP